MSAPVAPPQRSADELEALIEEARRRARRRRVGRIRAAALAVILAAGVLAGLSALKVIGGSGGTTNPRGVHVVRSRGPVEHWLIQTWQLPQPTTIDLETGEQRAAATTTEIWLDRSGWPGSLTDWTGASSRTAPRTPALYPRGLA
jgi:hypothetical protein